ncbi:MAG: DUF4142 domain-containing protein [Gemmatales bacterium]
MKHSRIHVVQSGVLFCCLLNGTWLFAQENKSKHPDYRPDEGDSISSAGIITPQENDRRIVKWLMIDVRGVLECSKDAQAQTKNENVKQFAQTMVTEHHSCLDQMENYRKERGKATNELGQTGNPPVARAENVQVDPKKSGILVKDEAGRQRDGKMMYHATDFVQVKEDICNQMKAKMSKEMKALPASEFDRAYMMHMVASHEMLLATCKSVRKTASKDLQAMLDQNIDKLTVHLKQAQTLCDQVCGKTTTGKLSK